MVVLLVLAMMLVHAIAVAGITVWQHEGVQQLLMLLLIVVAIITIVWHWLGNQSQ